MKMKRILALLLAACMLLGILAGCSKDAGTNDPSTPSSDKPTPSNNGKSDNAAAQTSAKYVYVAEEMQLNLPLSTSTRRVFRAISCTPSARS